MFVCVCCVCACAYVCLYVFVSMRVCMCLYMCETTSMKLHTRDWVFGNTCIKVHAQICILGILYV